MGELRCANYHESRAYYKNFRTFYRFPFEKAAALTVDNFTIERLLGFERSFFGAPWIKPDPLHEIQKMSLETIAEMHAAIPAGVIARHGTNPLFPPQVPDLIGIKDRKYLERFSSDSGRVV